MEGKIEQLYGVTRYPKLTEMKDESSPQASPSYYKKAFSVLTDLKVTKSKIAREMGKLRGRGRSNVADVKLLEKDTMIDLALNNIYSMINNDFDEHGTGTIEASTLNTIVVYSSLVDTD